MIGTNLLHYHIDSELGRGGMGVVYKATDEKLKRSVALKVLPPRAVADPDSRARFMREAETAAAVTHPNIATIYDVDEADGIVFIAMELVDGNSLRSLVHEGPLPLADTLRIATEVAGGLAKAHAANVIHRDLKPQRCLLLQTRGGRLPGHAQNGGHEVKLRGSHLQEFREPVGVLAIVGT